MAEKPESAYFTSIQLHSQQQNKQSDRPDSCANNQLQPLSLMLLVKQGKDWHEHVIGFTLRDYLARMFHPVTYKIN
jgi:hypothetical protein